MSRRRRAAPALIAGALLAAAAAGCSGPSADFPRESVSGTVKLDGQPLEEGMISFIRADNAEPVATGAVVKDGAYRVERAFGPAPGSHKVTVSSRKPTGKKLKNPDDPADPIDELKEVIPARYNLKSELTAEVKAGGPNSFDFELDGRPSVPARRR